MTTKPQFKLGEVTAAFAAGLRIGRTGNEHSPASCSPPATQEDVERSTETIMAKVSEIAATLAGITAQVNKAKDEVLTRINTLETALKDVDLPDDAQTALDELKAAVQAVDDINPDAEAPTT